MRRVVLAMALLAGCRFDPSGLGGGTPIDGAPPDAALPDAGLPDGATSDAAELDGELADAALVDAAAPDGFVFLDAAAPDAFVFLDAAAPDAFVFLDAPLGPGPGELWATPAGSVVVDGNLDSSAGEWPRASCISMNRDNDDHTDDNQRNIVTPGPAADDSSATFCAQWNASGIFLAARVHDEQNRSNSSVIYNDDSVAFYLDGDNSRDVTLDNDDYAFMIAPPGLGGTRAGDFFRNMLPANTLFEARITADEDFDAEAFIPWAALRPAPSAGARLGFDFVLLDDDDTSFIDPNAREFDTSMWWFRRTAPPSGNCPGHEDPFCNLATIGEVVLK